MNFIDLGLPSGTLWGDRNIGANSIEKLGYKYAYGECIPNYEFSHKKYAFKNREYYDNVKRCLKPEYNVAKVIFGSDVDIPTEEQFYELFDNCERSEESVNNISGIKYTGKNKNSIFFPCIAVTDVFVYSELTMNSRVSQLHNILEDRFIVFMRSYIDPSPIDRNDRRGINVYITTQATCFGSYVRPIKLNKT